MKIGVKVKYGLKGEAQEQSKLGGKIKKEDRWEEYSGVEN